MASQDPASQLDSTPAFLEDVVPKNYDKVYVCRLLAFDENGTGAMPGDVYLKPGEAALFGRNKDCTHKINDSYVSGLHCKVYHQKKDNEIWIKDYSSNGTFIDMRKIGKGNTTTLVNGNRITLSRPSLGFTVESFLELKEEEMLADRYHFRGELGRGAFSVVKKAISVKDGRLCAVKVINKAKLLGDPKSQEQVSREIEILKSVRHPNVIGYVDCVDTQHKMYIVLEYADGGELFDHIVRLGAFPEEDAKTIFLQLLQGVAYLHAAGIAHRDLKPENILVHEGLIKITDFGLARLSENKSFMRTLCGTPQYVAPEIIMMASRQDDPTAEGALPGYTTAVDMWSLGVILYLLLTGRQPFSAENNRALSLYSQIENVVYNWPVPEEFEDPASFVPISDGARDLVSRLLQSKPADRLSAPDALKHAWMESAWLYQAESEDLAKAAASSSSQQPSLSSVPSQGSASPVPLPSSPQLNDSHMDVEEEILPNTSSAKKRQHHSMNDKPPPILPSNSGYLAGAPRGTMPARVSYKPVNGASSSAEANGKQGNNGSAMDTDNNVDGSTSSSSAAGGLVYGASAAYIDVNVKRRKLAEK